MSEIFIVSDTHFNHNNILDFTDRPFNSVAEMNEGLIEAWNAVVGPDDEVWHLGDLAFSGHERTAEILAQLNGHVVLHKGNHDRSKVIKRLARDGYIAKVHEIGQYVKREKQQMWLTHYPMDIGLRNRKWSICGHLHADPTHEFNQVNVGMDSQHPIYQELARNKPFGTPIALDDLVAELMKYGDKLYDMRREKAKT